MNTYRILELAGLTEASVMQPLADLAKDLGNLSIKKGGKREGAINMILATLQWAEGGKLTHEQVSKALGTAYDAGMADAHKASSKQER